MQRIFNAELLHSDYKKNIFTIKEDNEEKKIKIENFSFVNKLSLINRKKIDIVENNGLFFAIFNTGLRGFMGKKISRIKKQKYFFNFIDTLVSSLCLFMFSLNFLIISGFFLHKIEVNHEIILNCFKLFSMSTTLFVFNKLFYKAINEDLDIILNSESAFEKFQKDNLNESKNKILLLENK